jgi:hypothetical protein
MKRLLEKLGILKKPREQRPFHEHVKVVKPNVIKVHRKARKTKSTKGAFGKCHNRP